MESERYKIKVTDHIKAEGHTEYIINIEKNGINFTFSERYSNLQALNNLMKKATNNKGFPKFPPKQFFGSNDEKFIIKRQNDLNNYFEIINNNPEFSTLPPLLKFIKEKKEKYDASNIRAKSEVTQITQLKRDLENKQEKDFKKSMKKTDDDYSKIVNDFNSQFYDLNNYYDKEMINESDGYIKYFKNNKIDENSSTSLNSGNESNFNFINKNDNLLDSVENKIKAKIDIILDLYKSLENTYETKEIIVPI